MNYNELEEQRQRNALNVLATGAGYLLGVGIAGACTYGLLRWVGVGELWSMSGAVIVVGVTRLVIILKKQWVNAMWAAHGDWVYGSDEDDRAMGAK